MKHDDYKHLAWFCTPILFAQVALAQVPCEYEVTTLQFPIDCGLGTVLTTGLSLNENGAVVGTYRCPLWTNFQGFVWTAEAGFEPLDPPQGVVEVFPTDINDDGVICGTLRVSGLGQRGFVYDKGEWTILDPVIPDAGWSGSNAINNAGVVVGQRSTTKDLNPHDAYMWSAKIGFTDLAGLEELSSATAIKGNIISGWTVNPGETKEGFLWDDGHVTFLGPIPGGLSSDPAGVTSQGVIVGSGAIPMDGYPFGIPRAFLWQEGKFTMLGTLPDHLISRAQDIRSNPPQIVGRSWNVDDTPTIAHGFIWEDGVMYDLNDFISREYGVLIEGATGISATGEIVANGEDADRQIVAFLLTPAPPFGDLNGDCAIGAVDLIILLSAWGRCADCNDCDADLDQNCVVGASDLLILLVNWG